MFAIVRLGNQQFKVKAGDFIRAPFQKGSQGDQIEVHVLGFGDESQFICDKIQLEKSKVKAVLLRQSLAKKIIVFKKKRRKGYRRTKGHRQKISELKIIELCSPDGQTSQVELKKSWLSAKTGDSKAGNKKQAFLKNKLSDKNKQSSPSNKESVRRSRAKRVKEAEVKKSSAENSQTQSKKEGKEAKNQTQSKEERKENKKGG